MTLNDVLLSIDAVACFLIFARLFTFMRNGARRRPIASFFAMMLMISCGAVAIQIWFGDYRQVNWAETAINVALLVAVFAARGNVMHLAKPLSRE